MNGTARLSVGVNIPRDCRGRQNRITPQDLTRIIGVARHDRYRLQIACRGNIACLRELCARQTVFAARCEISSVVLLPFVAHCRCSRCISSCAARCPGEVHHETLTSIARGIFSMNLSLRMRVSIAAGLVVAAGLVGCQTCRDCVDRIPRPGLPKLDSIVPFRKSKTPTYAEPYHPPKLEAVPDSQDPLILPAPAAVNVIPRTDSRPVSAPPALPPFEAEPPVPSAGLFPPGPVRRMGFETSSVIADPNIIQTGCCAPIVSSCCPPPCCPTPCCETLCCSTGGGLSSLLGAVTRPYYAAKYRIQNAKDSLRCKLSSIGSCCSPCSFPCCSPSVSSCSPCGSYVSNGYTLEGVVVNQYPLNSGCSTCSSGIISAPPIPQQYQTAPYQQWQQPAYYPPQYQYPPQPQPQYQVPQQTYPSPQAAVRQPVPQQQYRPTYQTTVPGQQFARSSQDQPSNTQQSQVNGQSVQSPAAQTRQTYTAPQPVQPAPQESSAAASPSEPAQRTSTMAPGHSPLPGQSPSTRVATIFRATRFQ